MFVKGVELKNIRSYRHEKIEFKEGNTLLLGNIGSGKSTILQALEFAIFGNQKGVIQASSLLRHGETQGSLLVNIVVDKKEICIFRSLKRDKTGVKQVGGYIDIDGVRHEGVVTEMRSKIYEVLGYDENSKARSLIYRYTVYTPQEEMKAIILENPETRMDIIRKIFGIDKYRIVKENASGYMKELRTLQRVIAERVKDYTELLESRTQKKDEQTKIRKNIDKEKKNLQKKLDLLKIVIKEYEVLEKNSQKLQQKQNKLQLILEKINSLEEKTRTLNIQKKEHEQSILGINRHMAELTSRKNRFMIGYSGVCEQYDIEKSENMDAVYEILDILRQDLERDAQKAELVYADLQKEDATVSTRIVGMQKELDMKQERTQKIINEHEEIEKKIKQLQEDKNRIKNITTSVSSDMTTESVKQELEDVQKQYEEFSLKKVQFRTKQEGYLQELDKLRSIDRCPLCKQDVPHKHKDSIMEELDAKVKKIHSILEKIEKNIDIVQTKMERAQQNVDKLQKMQVLLLELKQKEQYLEDNDKIYDEHNKELLILQKEMDILTEEIKKFTQRQKNIAESLSSMQKSMLQAKQKHKLIHTTLDDAKEIIVHTTNMRKDEEQKKLSTTKVEYLTQELKDIEKMIQEGVEKKCEIEKEIASSEILKELKDKKERKKEVEEEIQEIKIDIAQLQTDDKYITEQLSDKNEALLAMDKERKTLQRNKSIHTWLDTYFMPLMSAIERRVLSFYKREFESTFSDVFSHIIEDENIKAYIDDGFSPCIIQNGYDVPVSDLSGGEKTSVSLAYRLALFKVINSFVDNARTRDVLILDEPTDGFSDAQLDRLRDIFWDLSVRQLIIVSHETKMESFAQNFIRVDKNEHVSRVV